MWGPKKEAEVAPPALGEEAPHHHRHHDGGLGHRDLLSCTGFLPSTKEWVGVSSSSLPSRGGQPGTHLWDLAISMQEAPSSAPQAGGTSCQVLHEPGFDS